MLSDGTMEHYFDESAQKNIVILLTIHGEQRVWAVESTLQEAVDHIYMWLEQSTTREVNRIEGIL